MSSYNIIAASNESTVVAEYVPESSRSDSFQSEAALEKEFIRLLTAQGYEYLAIHSEAGLIENLRRQLELLNGYTFTNDEWKRFFTETLANANEGIVEKSRTIQTDHVKVLRRDDGTSKNIQLIDKKNIHNNRLQVINQYEETEGSHDTRYDVTILVNGLPLVHVELKRRGVAIREAFNQIKRYQRDSFWAASGLYEYVQIFIISNGTHTKYYSNTTRNSHIKEMSESAKQKSKKTSNSFEFTSFWADGNNKVIADLIDFTKTFLAKHTILNVLTRYCVFTSEEILMVMRPYQIAATERILNRIEVSTNYKKMGTVDAGGYIWHTTGSGKTLTSFKTAQLASALPYVDKVLFVVDRKDLDYQTMKEYERFEKGSANSNASTRVLQRQLEDRDEKGGYHQYKIIITTIQKLDNFVTRNKGHEVFNKHCVIIFDECHRSQFGDMHAKIVKAFKKYHLFGFTGTPIFAANAGKGKHLTMLTTPQTFGDQLHTYTIVDAINDGNVLPFRIDYVNTVKEKENIKDKNVSAIDVEKAMGAPERIREIVKYTLEHFDQKTKRNSFYSLKGKRMAGFNAMFAASSIPMVMKYYKEFQRQIAESHRQFTIERVQELRKNKRRPARTGKSNMFSGIVRCADCEEKLYYCTSNSFESRQDHFVCSTSRKRGKEVCDTHFIRAVVLEEGTLQHMRLVIQCIAAYEEEFRRALGAKKNAEARRELTAKKRTLQRSETRLNDLDRLFKRIYEDMVNGVINETRFKMLSEDYEKEQEELRQKIAILEEEIQNHEDQVENVDKFIQQAKKYLHLEKLTPTVLNDMVNAVYVHAPDKSSGHRVQDVEISYNYIGILPANLLYDIQKGKTA